MNYMQTNEYRRYKSIVPEYLLDRPRSTILHCSERKSKSCKYTKDEVLPTDMEQGIFEIKKSVSKTNTVNFGFNTNDKMPFSAFCTIPDWIKWHLPCKHFFAVFSLYPSWNCYKLPQAYLESAYLSTDQQSLDNFFKRSVDVDDKQCKIDSFDKNDNPDSVAHDVDVPTSTTDTGSLDEEKNYLNPIPRCEVCLSYLHLFAYFICCYRKVLLC